MFRLSSIRGTNFAHVSTPHNNPEKRSRYAVSLPQLCEKFLFRRGFDTLYFLMHRSFQRKSPQPRQKVQATSGNLSVCPCRLSPFTLFKRGPRRSDAFDSCFDSMAGCAIAFVHASAGDEHSYETAADLTRQVYSIVGSDASSVDEKISDQQVFIALRHEICLCSYADF